MSNHPPLIAPLRDGPVDVVGDVHGEIDALKALLAQLGYDEHGAHAQGRHLVFIGDLCDRGPDSPAVFERVMDLVQRGAAQCVLGNHELNLLRGAAKPGNGWMLEQHRAEQQPGGEFAHSRLASEAFKPRCLDFLATLPLALERPDLRVVHAAWLPGEIDVLRRARGKVLEVYEYYERRTNEQLEMEGLPERARREKAQLRGTLKDRHYVPDLLPAVGECDERHQMGSPVRVVTSGVERLAKAPFWMSGQWRMCDRVKWWEEYADDVPVIIGHYWRRFRPVSGGDHALAKLDMFAGLDPTDWMGPRRNVFCVDFSVGARYEQRKKGKTTFDDTALAAMRWPERELWGESGRMAS